MRSCTPRPSPRARRSCPLRPDERVRVRADALARVERRRSRPSRPSLSSKSKTSKFSRDPRRRHRLRDHDVAELQVPADDDLRRASCRAPRRSRRSPGPSSTAPWAERAPRLGDDAQVGVLAAQAGLLEERVQLDLVDRRRHAGLGDRSARGARAGSSRRRSSAARPSLLELDEGPPRLDVAVVRGHRPVDQVEVDVLHLEPLEARVAARAWPARSRGRRSSTWS